jgi:hypothetical protein
MSSVEDNEMVDSEIQMFQNRIFRCKSRDVMSPRTEIAVDLFDSIENLKELFIETGY